MVNIIASHAKGKALKKDALQISANAKAAKALNSKVVDSTLGTFYYEDGSFKCHKTINNILSNLDDKEKYAYSTSKGTKEFQEGAINWLFKDYRGIVEEKLSIAAIPTPGGTGAIVASVLNSTNEGETVLIPTPCWGPYVGICESHGRKVEKFNLFKDDKFGFENLKEKSEELIKKQGKLVVMINDPCNNPSGYTMTEEELNELISYFNSLQSVPVVLIYDCAYIDMSIDGINGSRKKLSVFKNAEDNVMILVAMSFSKSFFVYGQRLGAQVILSKNSEEVEEFFNAGNYQARNTWSNCNKAAITLIEKLDKNPSLIKEVEEEISVVVNLLKERADAFIKEADECGLKYYPFSSGFFLSIPCNNSDLVLDKLVEEENIYLIPVAGGVRVALCSMPVETIKGVAARIKKVIDKYGKI